MFTGTAYAAQSGTGPSGLSAFMPIIILFVIFYFILIRPQQKKQKELQRMIEALRKGDKVLTNGGIFGTVVGFKDNVLVLKIADEVKVEILKTAISSDKSNALGRRRPRDQNELIKDVRSYLFSRQRQPQIIKNYFKEQYVKYAA